jgi:hypothetical protein
MLYSMLVLIFEFENIKIVFVAPTNMWVASLYIYFHSTKLTKAQNGGLCVFDPMFDPFVATC